MGGSTTTTKTIVTKPTATSMLESNDNRSFSLWESYRKIATNHRLTLDALDETLSKLLFWLPHNNNNDDENESEDAWREIGYGILSLHRLSMHLALTANDNVSDRRNHYGMSIRTKSAPTVAATSARICLTVIHSLLPSLISLVVLQTRRRRRPRHNFHTDQFDGNPAAIAATTRLRLEQAKFGLRLYLLVHYWRQQQQCTGSPDFGILLDGGMYHSDQPQESIGIPWDHAKALQRRRNYVGERTGWTATRTTGQLETSCSSNSSRNILQGLVRTLTCGNAKTIVAEFLYTIRPLIWAWVESRHQQRLTNSRTGNNPKRSSLWKGWWLCFAMDLCSIRLHQRKHQTNPFAQRELSRRKLRLFLYLLRSPFWSNHTLPVLDRVSQGILQKMPFGKLLETILWDWVLYYQHPFVSEEG